MYDKTLSWYTNQNLKMPKCVISDGLDFHDFYTTEPLSVGDFEAKF